MTFMVYRSPFSWVFRAHSSGAKTFPFPEGHKDIKDSDEDKADGAHIPGGSHQIGVHQLHQPGGEIGAEKAAQAVHSGGDRRHVICSGGWDNRKPMAIVIGHQHFVSEPADGTDHQRRGLAGEPDQQQQSDPRDGIAEDHSHQGLSGIVKSRNFVSVLGIFVQIRDVGDAHGIYDALADAYESSCEADIQGIICCCAEDGANAEDDSGRDEDRLLLNLLVRRGVIREAATSTSMGPETM